MIDPSTIATNAKLNNRGFWDTEDIASVSYTKNGAVLMRCHEEVSFWHQHRMTCLGVLFDRFTVGSLLDIGGGNGQLSKFAQERGIETVLLEPSIDAVEYAARNGVRHVVHGTLQSARIAPASIEAISIFDVIEHIEDDRAFLRAIHSCLRPGGRLFITCPAYQVLFSSFDREVGHFRRYTCASLAAKLHKAGFKLEFASYLFYFLPLVIALMRPFYAQIKSPTRRRSFGHAQKSTLGGRIVSLVLGPEPALLRKNLSIPFGSSCVVVAQNVD